MNKTQLQSCIAVLFVSWLVSSILGAAFIGALCALAAIAAIFQLMRFDDAADEAPAPTESTAPDSTTSPVS